MQRGATPARVGCAARRLCLLLAILLVCRWRTYPRGAPRTLAAAPGSPICINGPEIGAEQVRALQSRARRSNITRERCLGFSHACEPWRLSKMARIALAFRMLLVCAVLEGVPGRLSVAVCAYGWRRYSRITTAAEHPRERIRSAAHRKTHGHR